MRRIWYVVGALGVVTALAYARDVADPIAVAGTPAPLSIESMRAIVDERCERPPGYRFATLQRVRNNVLEAGVAGHDLVVCSVSGDAWSTSKTHIDPPAALVAPGAYSVGVRTGVVWRDGVLEIGRVAPGVVALEFVLPSGQVIKAEVYDEVYFCHLPERITLVRVRAYDATGVLLHDGLI